MIDRLEKRIEEIKTTYLNATEIERITMAKYYQEWVLDLQDAIDQLKKLKLIEQIIKEK